jgi:hypothetical protein
MPAPPCKPDCKCGKHIRTKEHNYRIGQGVRLTQAANRRLGKPVNQYGSR